jgi:hypothetical protein
MHRESTTLYNDNQSAQRLSSNHIFHNRTKHIDVQHNFVRETIEAKLINLKHLQTEDMIADIFTKGLNRPKHHKCLKYLGMVCEP